MSAYYRRGFYQTTLPAGTVTRKGRSPYVRAVVEVYQADWYLLNSTMPSNRTLVWMMIEDYLSKPTRLPLAANPEGGKLIRVVIVIDAETWDMLTVQGEKLTSKLTGCDIVGRLITKFGTVRRAADKELRKQGIEFGPLDENGRAIDC